MRNLPFLTLLLAIYFAGCAAPPSENHSYESSNERLPLQGALATVRAVRGQAQFERNPGGEQGSIVVGMSFPEGTLFTTDAGSQLDLFLGPHSGMLRLTGSSQVFLKTLRDSKIEEKPVVETVIELRKGRVLGNVKRLPPPSRYKILVTPGYFASFDSRYDISDFGRISILEGTGQIYYGEQKQDLKAGQTYDPATVKMH